MTNRFRWRREVADEHSGWMILQLSRYKTTTLRACRLCLSFAHVKNHSASRSSSHLRGASLRIRGRAQSWTWCKFGQQISRERPRLISRGSRRKQDGGKRGALQWVQNKSRRFNETEEWRGGGGLLSFCPKRRACWQRATTFNEWFVAVRLEIVAPCSIFSRQPR